MKSILGAALCGMLMIGAAGADTLKVDPKRSRIHVDARSTGHGFTGTLEKYTAKVEGDTGKLEPTTFELDWKFADLNTYNNKRDHNMMKWLGDTKARGSFRFVKCWQKGGVKYAQGKLTINKVSKTISFPYTAKQEGNWITIDGTAKLDYTDFKLPLIRAVAVMKVQPELAVRFHVVGQLQ